nr:MAG TPA: Photosynthetic reaction centre, H-chain N-terminal region [Caudoviricetes sp.]DAS32672.1 MAG TPA: Photosynthetic reaction centre, H-chain N-terminal region [Caudoviricetes sp.]
MCYKLIGPCVALYLFFIFFAYFNHISIIAR